MQKSNIELSIIIINYNTSELTINCIDSIIRETKDVTYEVIVVDNNSEEDPLEIKDRFPSIVLLRNKKNVGFGTANNIGMRTAHGRYILLLNSDTLIKDEAIDKCCRFFETQWCLENNINLLGCQLVDERGNLQHSYFNRHDNLIEFLFKSNPIGAGIIRRFKMKKRLDAPTVVTGVSGAFMLFKKVALDQIKWFDPDIFLYSEETELCRERFSKKFNAAYYPDTYIVHFSGKSAPSKLSYIQSLLSYSLIWYKRGWGMYIFYLVVLIINNAFSLLIFPVVSSESKVYLRRFISSTWKISRYLIIDIPKYKSGWGSRLEPLKFKERING